MKKIAIIGFGNHVTKNILPALERMIELEVGAVYVRDTSKYKELAIEHCITLKDINEGIADEVDWVYISTPISTHFELASKYIKLGKNVICEKPLTDSLEKTKALFNLAEQHGVKLHEVCMYQYHKQFQHLKRSVSERLHTLRSVAVKFSIPHLDKGDIRYKKDTCGGAILDVGYYPISLIISLFGEPKEIKSIKNGGTGFEVDLFGVAIFDYDSFHCVAEWGIGLPYTNEVTVITENQMLKYDRIFSKPATFKTGVLVQEGFESYSIDIGEDDQFVNMFYSIIFNKEKDTVQPVGEIIKILGEI